MLVIKAGGSVITCRGKRPVFDGKAAARLAAALARLDEPFVLVHGTGSFGKPPAVRYGYLDGRVRPGSAPVARIKASLLRLHSAFLEELVKAGINAVSCPGCDFFGLRRGRPVLRDKAGLSAWLARGFVPVVNSDLFPSAGGEFRVVSSDALAAELAGAFRPRLTVFFTDTGGVLGPGGKVIRELDASGLARLVKDRGRSAKDVSGAMAGKAAELLRIGSRGLASLVLDGRRPEEFLKSAGRLVGGTLIRPGTVKHGDPGRQGRTKRNLRGNRR